MLTAANSDYQYTLTYSDWSFYFTSQGFIHVPKKPGGLKPELIDVDLVIGMLLYM